MARRPSLGGAPLPVLAHARNGRSRQRSRLERGRAQRRRRPRGL